MIIDIAQGGLIFLWTGKKHLDIIQPTMEPATGIAGDGGQGMCLSEPRRMETLGSPDRATGKPLRGESRGTLASSTPSTTEVLRGVMMEVPLKDTGERRGRLMPEDGHDHPEPRTR